MTQSTGPSIHSNGAARLPQPMTGWRRDPRHAASDAGRADDDLSIILSFDVEEHYRIEAAAGLRIDDGLKAHYRERLDVSTRWLLDHLAARGIRATFFIVGKIARHNPDLVRAIHRAGHEIASHSWDHQRVHHFTPATFREDVLKSKDALQQLTGEPVVGFRAPTFSIVRQTAWALDVLSELEFAYDSSIFPVWHDRYGVPRAPRVPFLARGREHSILEFPPATWRLLGTNLPVGGGGYFRLLPLFILSHALRQLTRQGREARVQGRATGEPHRNGPRTDNGQDCVFTRPPLASGSSVAMLYFHPWELDQDQARLPMTRLNGFRTYVGLRKTQEKLSQLLSRHRFVCARDVAAGIGQDSWLPEHRVGS